MSMITSALALLAEYPHRRLPRRVLMDVAKEILEGQASTAKIAAFLQGLRMSGETAHEVEAFVEVMLDHALEFPRPRDGEPIVDTCGTGGDGQNTFNISTTAALLAAAAGVRIAKHGNRSASSKCGSADVLERAGYNIEITPDEAAKQLAEHRFCFLFARTYHQSMRHAAEARRELGIRTLFNLCGPLSNPARPTHQLIGVSSRELVEPMTQTLRMMGSRGALVVHGTDGMDEISLAQVTEGMHLDSDGRMHLWHVSPTDLGIKPVEVADLVGGGPDENLRIMREVLEGGEGPHADVVNLNAGAILWVTGVEDDIKRGYVHAKAVQRSGAGAKLLDALVGAAPVPDASEDD